MRPSLALDRQLAALFGAKKGDKFVGTVSTKKFLCCGCLGPSRLKLTLAYSENAVYVGYFDGLSLVFMSRSFLLAPAQ